MLPRRTAAWSSALLAVLALVLAGCDESGTPSWSYGPFAEASPSASASAEPTSTPLVEPPAPTPWPSPVAGGWTFVKAEPCPDSRFECTTLSVPRDHFTEGGPTWEITFGIERASGERQGTFVTAVGGPGSSGLAVAESYTDALPEGVSGAYDVVFFDGRGIGLSRPIRCDDAVSTYYATAARPEDPAESDAFVDASRTFVDACIEESGVDEADLPFYSTRQSAEDLEAIREYLEIDKLNLYGESYGTQFVQTYAASHPDRVASLMVDGPVDLTVPALDFYAEAARAFESILIATMSDCSEDEVCAADFEDGDPLALYDDLAARLKDGPHEFEFPRADGTVETRRLTLTDLENAAVSYAYGPLDRAQFLRALASAADGNYVPLAHQAYAAIGLDPDTLETVPDETYSDAMYYAVECQDYAYHPGAGDADERAAAYLETGRDLGVDRVRMNGVFYGDLPCVFWPNTPKIDPRPAPIINPPYPMFVLVAAGDPITPLPNAWRLLNRAPSAYGFEQVGGAHVIFGRGDACPDEAIGAFLVDGTLPEDRLTICEGAYADEYLPVAAAEAGDYDDALDLMTSMETQIFSTDGYVYWEAEDPLTVGCDHGGTVEYDPTDEGTDVVLDDCEFTDGVALSGTGSYDDETAGVVLEVTIGGRGDSLSYESDGEGGVSVEGTYLGQPVSLDS